MARTQQRGVNAMTVWMIVFVALWLTSTVFLVILYTGREELVSQNNTLRKRNSELISPSEASSIEQAKTAGVGDQTVVGAMEAARGETAAIASGDRADDVARVRTKRDELLRAIRRDARVSNPNDFNDLSLLAALTKLYDEYQRESGLRRDLDSRVTELDAKLAEQIQLTATQRADFDQRLQDAAESIRRTESERETYRKERDIVVTRLESDFKARRDQTDTELTKERQDRAKAERQLTEMQKKLAVQREKYGELLIAPEQLVTARQADGRVLTAIPGDDFVYIDRGESDRLVLGLQFAVYSAEAGIPSDGRAKAQIEVVSIGQSYAECNIVSVALNNVILEGDWIANPVYDPARPLTFLVVGDFDLNRDGKPDAAGADAVESMITSWGGRVTDRVDALTDFVVLGRAPQRFSAPGDGTPDRVELDKSRQQALDHYMEIVAASMNLAVPVMTQDVFLNFLGYTRRYVRR